MGRKRTGPRRAEGGEAADGRETREHGQTLGNGLRNKTRKGEKKGFLTLKATKQMNSNINLNSNTQKQCTSMYATVNSYSSLFN
jgi:hypothetical protein